MNTKVLALILLLSLLLTACYEGRGYAYDHLNNQDPARVRTQDPGRIETSPDNDTIGGVYEHLNTNLCNLQPECCGTFSTEDEWYKELQIRAAIEKNPEICQNLPEKAFVVDCPGEESYTYYDKQTCINEARR